MFNHRPGPIQAILVICAMFCFTALSLAQEDDPMRVERIKVVDQTKPVFNIYVDENNVKWIGNSEAIYKVEAKDIAERIEIPSGQQSLLQLPGGDADIRWSKSEISGILGEAKITTAAYDDRDDMLWIGTDGWGLYKIKVSGSNLRLVEEIYIDNSKLRSDFINLIYISPEGKVWVATEDGVMLIENGSSQIFQKYFNVQTISGNRRQTWATGDGLVWIIDRKNNWSPIEINKFEIEGEMHDIAFDEEGKIWIASNVMTSYHIDTKRYQHFGPGQYFTSQFVNYVSVDDDGTIWVGTDDKGVYIIEKASTITLTTNLDRPLSCNTASADAQVTARAIGGNPPYTFGWSDGGSGEQRADLAAGLYTITVTDTDGISKTAEVEIADPEITLTVSQEQEESDLGASDGIAALVAQGGVPGYNAQWSTGASGARLTGVGEGTYSVTITDKAGCTASGDVVITRKLGELAVSISQTNVVHCAGGDDGANILAEIKGGKEPYTYAWGDIGGGDGEVQGLTPGTYQVTITDAVGSTATASIEIQEPGAFLAETSVVQSATTDNSDGQASVTLNGGAEPFAYAWSNGETADKAVALGPGGHQVTVTDANGCTAVGNVVITEDILPIAVSVLQHEEILCAGDASGNAAVDLTGGKGPFTYLWSNGATTETLEGIPAGQYSVTVTDAQGTSAVFQTELIEPSPMIVNTVLETAATANNQDGSARVNVEGGAGEYTYAWDNGAADEEITEVGEGTYVVTVTDANGCTATSQVVMTEDILPLALSIEQQGDILCPGDATGGLLADVTGGKSPYQYEWSDGVQTQVRENLPAGIYSVTITDVTGVTATFESELTEPEAIVVNALVESSATTDQADGVASVSVSGGSPDYVYSWSNGSTVERVETLAPGEHTVTVTDVNGCTQTASVTITEDILPLALQIEQSAAITCNGASDGSATAMVSGGKGPYQYAWSSSNTTWDGTMDGANASNVPAGVLSLKVTDALGSEADFQIEIVEPTSIVANAIAEAPASTGNEDGSARVEGTGGSEKYTPLWDNGEVTQTAVALAPGDHTVTITDDAGCTAVATVTITENILPFDGLISAPSTVMCNSDTDASLQAEVTGGKGPYQYAWSDGQTTETATGLGAGTYEVSVTDALGTEIVRNFTILEPQELSVAAVVISVASTDESDGSIEATVNGGVEPYTYAWDGGTAEANLEGVGAGSYTLTVTDANGCTAESTVEMTEDILPLTLDIERDNSQVLCFGQTTGIAKALPQGGKRPFTYSWSDGSAEAERSDLGKGEYVITVTDALATQATAMVMIIEPALLEATAITVASASTDNSDGQATVQPSGGTAPYTYSWSNGETADAAVGLAAGQHTVTVTDINGCTVTSSVEITEDILPLAITVQQSSDISCAGMKDADLTSTISGGKGPFQVAWSNGGSGEALSGLGAGSYAVTVTDAVGQSAESQIEVIEPAGLDAELVDIRAAAAEHVPDGKATVKISGGAGGYAYTWDSGESGESAKELSIGSHTVTVTDANGCSTVLSTEIKKKILPTLTAEALNSGQAVRMEKLQFEADSTAITTESVPTLTELYEFLYDNPTIVVEVGGHTNGLPEHAYCDSLSRLRAKSVAQWIVNEGIDEKRVYFRGYGKREPVATNRTPEGRRKNQRVEVKIVRLEED